MHTFYSRELCIHYLMEKETLQILLMYDLDMKRSSDWPNVVTSGREIGRSGKVEEQMS